MDTPFLITTLITIVLAFTGYFLTYLNNIRISQRTDRLARVNRQLSELYGPLFALTNASKITWDEFRAKHRPGKDFWDNPTDDDLKAWQLWVKTVFLPITSRMYELVITKSDLLIEREMPNCLLILCAHVAGYQPIIRKWEAGDFSRYTSYVSYPTDLLEYAQKSFQYLKAEQERLLGKSLKKKTAGYRSTAV